jgi:hypothetical protein
VNIPLVFLFHAEASLLLEVSVSSRIFDIFLTPEVTNPVAVLLVPGGGDGSRLWRQAVVPACKATKAGGPVRQPEGIAGFIHQSGTKVGAQDTECESGYKLLRRIRKIIFKRPRWMCRYIRTMFFPKKTFSFYLELKTA